MFKILVTGKGSYIGSSLKMWLGKYPDSFMVDTLDMRDKAWFEKDFSNYNVVFHAAGLAHVPKNSYSSDLYDSVNRDLAIETALKAKNDGVRQFIFMSSALVYGTPANGRIEKVTVPCPDNDYGKSKLMAEEGLLSLSSVDYKIVIIRSPMVYGKGSKGNYPKLAKAAVRMPIFPDYNNARSMIHIDNLTEFIRLLVDHGESGIFHPQNREHVRTADMVKEIAAVHGREIRLTKIFNPVLRFLHRRSSLINKVFGNLAYELDMSDYKENYRVRDFKESILLTEK